MSEHTQPTTAGANQSGNVANNTYTSTIASTASTVIGQITGFAALNENSEYPSASTSQDQAQAESQPGSSSATNSTSLGADSAEQEAQTEEEVPSVMARDNFTEENERGPSDPSRPETTQKKIGTETGIPTTAGAGTTLSPDDDVKSAAKKEASLRKNDSAAVGVDYSDQPCPTSDARRANPSSGPAEGKTNFADREEQLQGSAELHSNSSASRSGSGTSGGSGSTAATSTTPGLQEEEGSTGEGKVGWKNKLKGEAKILAGKITRNEDKVEAGRTQKAGVQA